MSTVRGEVQEGVSSVDILQVREVFKCGHLYFLVQKTFGLHGQGRFRVEPVLTFYGQGRWRRSLFCDFTWTSFTDGT